MDFKNNEIDSLHIVQDCNTFFVGTLKVDDEINQIGLQTFDFHFN